MENFRNIIGINSALNKIRKQITIATTKVLNIVICKNLDATLKKNQEFKAQIVTVFGAVF